MPAVTAQDVSAWSERESLYVFVGAACRSASKRLIGILFLPFLLVFSFILAQLYPISMRKTLREVTPRLPFVDDREVLMAARDAFKLSLGAGHFYSRACVARSSMRAVLEDIEETIDSLDLVLTSERELDDLVDEARDRASPELPLELQREIA